MASLALAVLGVPLSIWAVERAYTGLIANNSSPRISSFLLLAGVATVALRTSLSLINSYRFECRRRALGCGVVRFYPHKDPILGLDAFVKVLRAFGGHVLYDFYLRNFEKYGNTHYLLTLGNKMLMTNDAENIKIMLGPKMDDWTIGGPRLNVALPVLGPNSIFCTVGEAWQETRALLRPAFVRDQYANLRCFARHSENFLSSIPADGTTFDMQSLLLDMTMDSSTDFLLGCSTSLLTKASPEAQQFARDFEYGSRESAKIGFLGDILYHLPHPGLKAARHRLREYVRFYLNKAVAEKQNREKGGEKEATDDRGYIFLDEMFKANPPEEYIIDQILTILIAGRDTTATAMAAVFYFLARHPEAVEKLRQEIKSVGVEEPTWEQLKQMKYLNNVIKEALRLCSPVAANSRSAARDTILPRGGGKDGSQPILVPKGTSCRWVTHALHRNKEVYGEDVEEFRPERWDSIRPGWEYIPFGGGPRICLGQQFALTQIAYIVFKFFNRFRAIEPRDDKPYRQKAGMTISFPDGCLVSVVRDKRD